MKWIKIRVILKVYANIQIFLKQKLKVTGKQSSNKLFTYLKHLRVLQFLASWASLDKTLSCRYQ